MASNIENTDNIVQMLKKYELHYGCVITGVKRNKKSPNEPKNYYSIHQGGDKFLHHNYSLGYAEALNTFKNNGIKLIEIGVLDGHGLATLCDVLPEHSTVIGLDIDTDIFELYKDSLRSKGAFQKNKPIVHSFDQYNPSEELLMNIGKADIVIDDGAHTIKAVTTTLAKFKELNLIPKIYIIEDIRSHLLIPNISKICSNVGIKSYDGQLTVIYF